jgi:dynein heavy chain
VTVECIVQVEISRQYGIKEWRDDVKSILQRTSSTEQHTVFLFTDSQVVTPLHSEVL